MVHDPPDIATAGPTRGLHGPTLAKEFRQANDRIPLGLHDRSPAAPQREQSQIIKLERDVPWEKEQHQWEGYVLHEAPDKIAAAVIDREGAPATTR